jgi:hypothetical protein
MAERTFNTPIREPWNPKIHAILKTIDLHTELYIKSEDTFHLKQSEILRDYIKELKTWLLNQEDNQ